MPRLWGVLTGVAGRRYVGTAAGSGEPGKRIKFTPREGQKLVKERRGTFAPFEGMFGLSFAREFKGTLFRFPLRDEAQAASSEICRVA